MEPEKRIRTSNVEIVPSVVGATRAAATFATFATSAPPTPCRVGAESPPRDLVAHCSALASTSAASSTARLTERGLQPVADTAVVPTTAHPPRRARGAPGLRWTVSFRGLAEGGAGGGYGGDGGDRVWQEGTMRRATAAAAHVRPLLLLLLLLLLAFGVAAAVLAEEPAQQVVLLHHGLAHLQCMRPQSCNAPAQCTM